MPKTYAVVWTNSSPERHVGRLVVDAGGVRLEGAMPGRNGSAHTISESTLSAVELDRSAAGRFDGRPCICLSFTNGSTLRVASLDGPGTVCEIAAWLTQLVPGTR